MIDNNASLTEEDATLRWHAQLIAGAGQDGASLLRREFELDSGHGDVVAATLMPTAQSVAEAWVNGLPVSDDLPTPGWSASWATAGTAGDSGGQRTVPGTAARRGAFAQLEVTFHDGRRQLLVPEEAAATLGRQGSDPGRPDGAAVPGRS